MHVLYQEGSEVEVGNFGIFVKIEEPVAKVSLEITREVREDNALVREIMHTHTRYSKRLLINTTHRFRVTSDGWVMQTIIMQNIIADELSDILSIKLKYAINGKISISTRALCFTYGWILNTVLFFSIRKVLKSKHHITSYYS